MVGVHIVSWIHMLALSKDGVHIEVWLVLDVGTFLMPLVHRLVCLCRHVPWDSSNLFVVHNTGCLTCLLKSDMFFAMLKAGVEGHLRYNV